MKPKKKSKQMAAISFLSKKQKASVKKAFQLTEMEIDILIGLSAKYRDDTKGIKTALLKN